MSQEKTGVDCARTAGKAAFVFGVSGHRDPIDDDFPLLAKQIQTVFDCYRSAYPNVCFQLLSPLAEGADRIAAEVALQAGIGLVVPLPMPQAEYERDFATPESLNSFRELLAASVSVFAIPVNETDVQANQYAAVGEYIARRSNVLILLWDGRDNNKVGGTAWVKKRREHWSNLAKAGNSTLPPLGYIGTIQIVTPRRADPNRPRIEIIGDLPPIGAD